LAVAVFVAAAALVAALLVIFVSAARDGALSRGSADTGVYRGSEPAVVFPLPAFSLRDQHGDVISTRSLRGRALVVTFLDTQCEDACPVLASQIAHGLRLLGAEDRQRVAAVAFSVDPREDTPASVRDFLRRHRATRELHYVVADESRLRPLWRAFKIAPSTDSGDDSLHSAPARIYDANGHWVATLHVGVDLTPANIAHDLKQALASR
jgi:protein SCO1/2